MTLPESVEKTLKPKTLQVESLSNPVLALRKQDNTITSLDVWLTAFSIYMSIYIEKTPRFSIRDATIYGGST